MGLLAWGGFYVVVKRTLVKDKKATKFGNTMAMRSTERMIVESLDLDISIEFLRPESERGH